MSEDEAADISERLEACQASQRLPFKSGANPEGIP